MGVGKYQIRKIIKARLIRRYRGGLIKRKTKAECAFERILKKIKADFIAQAGFLSPISFYIVDFYIKNPYKLIIEIDDETHREKRKYVQDRKKISYLRNCGFKVLKFTNGNVLNRSQKVERQLLNCLQRIEKSRNKKRSSGK